MFYVKGSQSMYLVDYNVERSQPIWANNKEDAFHSQDISSMYDLCHFLQQNGSLCEVVWE